MRKLVKILSITTLAIILLAITATIILTTFVNPNRFKPMLAAQVTKYTGRQVIIDEDLSWSIFPNIGIKIDHMVVNNPSTFKEPVFAELNHVVIGIKLMPLFSGKIDSSGISLKTLKLNLIKNANGEGNWQFNTNQTTTPTTRTTESPSNTTNTDRLHIIENLNIDNADITWINKQTKQKYHINNMALNAKHIQFSQAFPLTVEFDYVADNSAGHATISGDLYLQPATQVYSYHNLQVKSKLKHTGIKLTIDLTGNIDADLVKQVITLPDLKGSIAKATITGALKVNNLNTKPVITGQLHINPFNLTEWLKDTGISTDAPHTKNTRGDFNFNMTADKSEAQGKLKIDEIQTTKTKITAINATTIYQNDILNINPFTAKLYQGTLDGQAKVDLTTATPRINVNTKLSQAQLTAIQGDTNNKLKVIGLANISTQITTNGKTADSLLQNINGTTQFSIDNGALVGLDLDYLIDSAYSLATHKAPTLKDTSETRFTTLTGTGVIHNGVFNNQDLKIDSAFLNVNGTGRINLVNQNIDYTLSSSVKKHANDEKDAFYNLYGVAIPVLITNNLKNPSIRLDTNTLLKIIAERQIQRLQKKSEDKIREKLQEKIPPQAIELLGNLLDKKN